MMDQVTVEMFSLRMVEEPDSVAEVPNNLEGKEVDLFYKLRERYFGKPRLEQERLATDYITKRLRCWIS